MNIQTITIDIRKCGRRKPHGLYAIGGSFRSKDGVLSPFTLLNPPIPYQAKVHRTARVVDSYAILERQPSDEWWLDGSKKTEKKKKGNAWALDTFGMTIAERLKIGDCAGAKDVNDALSILAGQIRLSTTDGRITNYFRSMVKEGIDSLPRVDVHYAKFHQHLAYYLRDQRIDNLMHAQAALWRMAYNIPPSKRSIFIPYLQSFLMLMHLTKDAIDMGIKFPGG